MDKIGYLLNLPCVVPADIVEELLERISTLETAREQREEAILKVLGSHEAQIATMDEIAAENIIKVTCRKCGDHYELPCDLSEFDPEYSYCGKGGPSPCTP